VVELLEERPSGVTPERWPSPASRVRPSIAGRNINSHVRRFSRLFVLRRAD
jgi:hypothetical protein